MSNLQKVQRLFIIAMLGLSVVSMTACDKNKDDMQEVNSFVDDANEGGLIDRNESAVGDAIYGIIEWSQPSE